MNTCGAASGWTATNNFCFEGFSATDPKYVSTWGACNDTTHTRTRTCNEDCGTGDCVGVTLSESCQGRISGTLFDASNISVCPAFDPVTGYATGLPAGTGIASRNFGLSDASSVPTHPWSPLSAVRTDGNGNFNISVYPNATYNFDFALLADQYVVTPKLICSGSGLSASVPNNSPTCTTQPCSTVKNMTFGFTREFGGWWQAAGASVHGDKDKKV